MRCSTTPWTGWVGDNDRQPWSQLPGGDRPDLRLAEFEARRAAAPDWIDAAFDEAETNEAPGFQDIRGVIVARSRSFERPVLLVHGDEHRYEQEPGYAGVPNLTRLETFGDTATEWLRLTVDPRDPAVFAWAAESV